jgi:CRISPR-associated protein Csb2
VFAFGIRYLCGWAMATHPANRERPEWPPHPDRVFMALAAAHFETEGSDSEHASLQWLEGQSPPTMTAAAHSERTVVTSYVPVNDVEMPTLRKGKEPSKDQVNAALGLLPDRRLRQARFFPVAVPESDTVFLRWDTAEPSAEYRHALGELCRKVTYLGHSASLVQMWVEDAPPPPNLSPVDGSARYRLRVPGPGRLSSLETRFAANLRPSPALWYAYDAPRTNAVKPSIPRSVFGDNLVILRRVGGRTLGLEATLRLGETLRKTVMSCCPVQPLPEWIGGHKPDGARAERPHVAVLPLPDIGHEHADGHLLGMALAIPREISAEERARCLGPICFGSLGEPVERKLVMGNLGEWIVQLDEREDRPLALKPETWTGSADHWATVTPIVLDRHPKADGDAEAIIGTACERIGLPRPQEIAILPVSKFEGVPHSRAFPALPAKFGKSRRFHTHAVLKFGTKVLGPVLLCAGRYRGYGLCRPWWPKGGDAQ